MLGFTTNELFQNFVQNYVSKKYTFGHLGDRNRFSQRIMLPLPLLPTKNDIFLIACNQAMLPPLLQLLLLLLLQLLLMPMPLPLPQFFLGRRRRHQQHRRRWRRWGQRWQRKSLGWLLLIRLALALASARAAEAAAAAAAAAEVVAAMVAALGWLGWLLDWHRHWHRKGRQRWSSSGGVAVVEQHWQWQQQQQWQQQRQQQQQRQPWVGWVGQIGIGIGKGSSGSSRYRSSLGCSKVLRFFSGSSQDLLRIFSDSSQVLLSFFSHYYEKGCLCPQVVSNSKNDMHDNHLRNLFFTVKTQKLILIK